MLCASKAWSYLLSVLVAEALLERVFVITAMNNKRAGNILGNDCSLHFRLVQNNDYFNHVKYYLIQLLTLNCSTLSIQFETSLFDQLSADFPVDYIACHTAFSEVINFEKQHKIMMKRLEALAQGKVATLTYGSCKSNSLNPCKYTSP